MSFLRTPTFIYQFVIAAWSVHFVTRGLRGPSEICLFFYSKDVIELV